MTKLIIDRYALCQADLCARDAEYLLRWHNSRVCKPGAASQTYSCANPAHLKEIYYYSCWMNKRHPAAVFNLKTKEKEREMLKYMKKLLDTYVPMHQEPIPVFKTEKGSLYYRKPNGFWLRHKYNGEIFNGYLYIGSINPSENPLYKDDSETDLNKQITEMIREIISGKIPGFVPFFALGNSPLGIKGYGPDEITIKTEHAAKQEKRSIIYNRNAFPLPHIGHAITKIF